MPFAVPLPAFSEAAAKMFKDHAASVLRQGLGRKFHPDLGGSHQCMQTANEVVDVLLPHVFKLIGEVTAQ